MMIGIKDLPVRWIMTQNLENSKAPSIPKMILTKHTKIFSGILIIPSPRCCLPATKTMAI